VQEAASQADPRTTMRYDRARASLDRNATYITGAGPLACIAEFLSVWPPDNGQTDPRFGHTAEAVTDVVISSDREPSL
jgi:hypothetical protein